MKVTLHFGAHKTASSYLQRVLAHNHPMLRQHGIGFVHLMMMREKITNPLAWARNFPGDTGKISTAHDGAARFLNWCISERLLGEEKVPQRHLVLSDENLIGAPREIVNRQMLYPTLSERMAVLTPMLGDVTPVIYLSLRNPETYGPSIFCEALVAKHAPEPGLREFRRGWLQNAPRWTRVVAGLREAFPASEIRVWDFADFRALEERILTGITGMPADTQFEKLNDLIRPSITDKAARKLLSIQRWRGNKARFDALPDVRRKYAEGKKLQMWSKAEKKRLSADYAEDLAEIAAMDGVTLMRPGA